MGPYYRQNNFEIWQFYAHFFDFEENKKLVSQRGGAVRFLSQERHTTKIRKNRADKTGKNQLKLFADINML